MKSKSTKLSVTTTVLGKEVLAGTLYLHASSVTFAYAEEYLAMPKSYDIFPCLPRTSAAPFHFSGLGPFSDSAPDRWGRTLINRELKRNRVSEAEYLLNVNDAARQGALRYCIEGVPQAPASNIPLVIDLPELLNIANSVVLQEEISDENAAKLFLASGSLGGARPKACVDDGGVLHVAKFPKPAGDAWDVIGWEYVTLKLAAKFGIRTPEAKLVSVKDAQGRNRGVMLSRRFDRESDSRIHYMSALTALEAADGEGADWQDLAELTLELGADLHELWKRALFGTAIGNTDNHLRNHAYLMTSHGWQLSPAFDMNPQPVSGAVKNFDVSGGATGACDAENAAGAGTGPVKGSAGSAACRGATDTYQLSLFGENELTLSCFTTKAALDLFGISKKECASAKPELARVMKGAVSEARKAKLDAKSIEKIAARFEDFAL